MLSMKRVATSLADTVFVVVMKRERLVSRSATSQIELCPCSVSGKSVMKSIEIERHRSSRTCSGSMSPGVVASRGLFRRQSSQPAMYFLIVCTPSVANTSRNEASGIFDPCQDGLRSWNRVLQL